MNTAAPETEFQTAGATPASRADMLDALNEGTHTAAPGAARRHH